MYQRMPSAKVTPDAATYNTLLDRYHKNGDLDKADQVLHRMYSAKMTPDAVTYNTIMSGYAKNGDVDKAE